uniref:Uncharacterized protein n=1 Tax=Meloidogyne enterolobii TaxID=390850 RepID=A0A6V7XPG4_MELEN|nr:unnamed protein product [Meloidogyne enterolobii]
MLESYFLTGAGGCKGKYPVQNVPLHNWDILGGVTTPVPRHTRPEASGPNPKIKPLWICSIPPNIISRFIQTQDFPLI